jgi:hypothetical protein
MHFRRKAEAARASKVLSGGKDRLKKLALILWHASVVEAAHFSVFPEYAK